MSKKVFTPLEIKSLGTKVVIEAPDIIPQKVSEEEEAKFEEYAGPSIQDLKKEAEEFKQNWEQEKAGMLAETRQEADEIIKNAENEAFEILKRKRNELQEEKLSSADEAERIINEAKDKARSIEKEVEEKAAQKYEEARDKGYKEGYDDGYDTGKAEVERLVDRLNVIVTESVQKRHNIIEETEQQIINLILLIAKKVIKVISENQKNVVINNTIQALRKLRSRGDIAIRVNLADLELSSKHKRDFIEMVEGIKSVRILEDATVDKGGCIIETDFGNIDARISSQLNEISDKILELMPIKTKGKEEHPV